MHTRLNAIHRYTSEIPDPRGILKFGFGRDITAAKFESRPIQRPIFQEKVVHSPILAKLWEKLPDFFENFLKFETKFGKIWKIDIFIYQILHFIRGHSYTKRLILLRMLAARPRRFFFTKYLPGAQTLHTVPCNGIISHGAQIGGLLVFADHTYKHKKCVHDFLFVCLHSKTTVDAGDIQFDKPRLS